MSVVDAAPPPYYPELPVTQISKHPKNPRHRAIADPDMVSSVVVSGILEPLIVAPTEPGSTKFILIAGHRRLDASKKAKRKTVPAVVRYDLVTEGQQIEAMIIENGHRKDLTPVEEAEGYKQLELLGYKAPAIATAVGRDVKTIRARLKLLTLSKESQKRIHGGQMSLEHAADIASFSNEPAVLAKLEKASHYQFSYQLQAAKRNRKTRQENAARVAQLAAAGATVVEIPKGKDWWSFQNAERGPVNIDRTFSADTAAHPGCLGYLLHEHYDEERLVVICTDPSAHDDQIAAEQQERIEQRRLAQEADDARRVAAEVASDVRVQTVTRLLEGAKLTGVLADVARGTLPALLDVLVGPEKDRYFDLMGLEAGQRWTNTWGESDRALISDHIEDLVTGSDQLITKALCAVLIGRAEGVLRRQNRNDAAVSRSYLGFLDAVGHPFCEVDEQLLAHLVGEKAEVA